jgi:hypothetical protein
MHERRLAEEAPDHLVHPRHSRVPRADPASSATTDDDHRDNDLVAATEDRAQQRSNSDHENPELPVTPLPPRPSRVLLNLGIAHHAR